MNDISGVGNKQEHSGWFSTILLVFIVSGMGVYLLIELVFSIRQLLNITDRPLYLVGSNNLVPLLFLIPTLFITAIGLILKELNLLTSERFNWGVKTILLCGIAFVITRVLYGLFFIDSFMTSHGYKYCNPLTSASAFSSRVWVSDPGYCLEDSRNVRSEVMDWMDAKMEAGERPTAAEAEQQIKQFAEAYQARFNRF